MQFTKAERKKAKLRLALTGPSGSGKTWGALDIAQGIGGRIAVIDTEKGSASLYSHRCDFDTLELSAPFTPERYVEAINAAEAAGYDVIVIDSASHEWSGSGGCLDANDVTARTKFQGNTWAAWNLTTPRHRAFIDAMLQSRCHIIATGRSKTETVQSDGPNGKKKVVKLGMKTEQRDGFEYEFTVVLDITHDGHYATASKDRTELFGGDAEPISIETGKKLRAWLDSGAEAVDPPAQPAPAIGMPANVLADWLAYFETVSDIEELSKQKTKASESAMNIGDETSYRALRAAANARYKVLAKVVA